MSPTRSLTLVALLAACGGADASKSAPSGSAAAPTGAPATAATEGAPAAAPAAGKRTDVDIDTFAKAQDAGGITLIDVRTKEEYDGGHVKGAILVPIDELTPEHAAIANLPKDKPFYVICQVGGRSSKAADILSAAGFQVVNVKGGTGAWIASGRPVE